MNYLHISKNSILMQLFFTLRVTLCSIAANISSMTKFAPSHVFASNRFQLFCHPFGQIRQGLFTRFLPRISSSHMGIGVQRCDAGYLADDGRQGLDVRAAPRGAGGTEAAEEEQGLAIFLVTFFPEHDKV